MNDTVLAHLRDLGAALRDREKRRIGIVTDKGTISATYDPLFKSVTVAGMTVPEQELRFWVKAACGATVIKILLTRG